MDICFIETELIKTVSHDSFRGDLFGKKKRRNIIYRHFNHNNCS